MTKPIGGPHRDTANNVCNLKRNSRLPGDLKSRCRGSVMAKPPWWSSSDLLALFIPLERVLSTLLYRNTRRIETEDAQRTTKPTFLNYPAILYSRSSTAFASTGHCPYEDRDCSMYVWCFKCTTRPAPPNIYISSMKAWGIRRGHHIYTFLGTTTLRNLERPRS